MWLLGGRRWKTGEGIEQLSARLVLCLGKVNDLLLELELQ